MNDRIRKQFEISNPFIFKHISNLKSVEEFEDTGPCVIMASPGMLQSGLSQELFEMWCSDPRNGVIIPGYCVEGTLAKKILSEPSEITLSNGSTVPLKMTVRSISFSAHSDRAQTEEFVASIRPPYVVLVHGDPANMTRLRQALLAKFDFLKVEMPKNCQTIELMFHGEKTARVIGDLAFEEPRHGQKVKGILLEKNFEHILVSDKDLKTYSDISCAGILQRIVIPIPTNQKWKEILSEKFKCEIHETENFLNIIVCIHMNLEFII
jgi:cleavage and polyadenylation specificity factor subunit 3